MVDAGTLIGGTAAQGIMAVPEGAEPPALARHFHQETGLTQVARWGEWIIASRGRTLAWYEPASGRVESRRLLDGFRIGALAPSSSAVWIGGERTFAGGTRRPLLYRLVPDTPSFRLEAWPAHPLEVEVSFL